MGTEEFAEDQKPSPPRILVGVDGSDDAMRAVMYALGTAERTGHDIWLVHAVDENARAFYIRHGLEPARTDPLHLMILIKDIVAAIDAANANQ